MERTQVLDGGYVEFVESWGSDERIIEAARMSTGKGFLGWEPGPCPSCGGKEYSYDCSGTRNPCTDCTGTGKIAGDKNLLRHLWTKKHATPFEMGGVVIEVQAPIFVFREWHRHRTQSFNEMSARYTPLPDLNYVPTVERLLLNQGTKNKQAGTIHGSDPLTTETAEQYRTALTAMYRSQQELYEQSLKMGVPKELARVHLPVGRYSRMRASANLRNWLAFLTLRLAKDAQWEIRQYAEAVGSIIEHLFPRTWQLFEEGRVKESPPVKEEPKK